MNFEIFLRIFGIFLRIFREFWMNLVVFLGEISHNLAKVFGQPCRLSQGVSSSAVNLQMREISPCTLLIFMIYLLKVRAPPRGARTSARLASLAQFTPTKAPSAHRSRFWLIQQFWETLLAQNHTCRQAQSAHLSHCSLIQRFRETLLSQNHTR